MVIGISVLLNILYQFYQHSFIDNKNGHWSDNYMLIIGFNIVTNSFDTVFYHFRLRKKKNVDRNFGFPRNRWDQNRYLLIHEKLLEAIVEFYRSLFFVICRYTYAIKKWNGRHFVFFSSQINNLKITKQCQTNHN